MKNRSKRRIFSFRLAAVVLLVLLLAGCISLTGPVTATTAPVGSKTGEATGVIILGFGRVDAGITAAAANGGITEISTVDVQIQSVLGVYYRITTIVTGE